MRLPISRSLCLAFSSRSIKISASHRWLLCSESPQSGALEGNPQGHDILGPAQRVDVITALKAMTIWPAWQHFEEDEKGSLEVGKLADFVLLSDDPLAVDPEGLAALTVRATYKQGVRVYPEAGAP